MLQEYSILIHKIRVHREQGMELAEAISASVRECVEEGVLAEFLKRNGGEIMSFLFQELSREECEAIREQDGYTRGLAEGRKEGEFEAFGKLVRQKLLTLEQAAEQLGAQGAEFTAWYQGQADM